jgi:hypothetical protein
VPSCPAPGGTTGGKLSQTFLAMQGQELPDPFDYAGSCLWHVLWWLARKQDYIP